MGMVTFTLGDLGRFAEDTNLVVNLGKTFPFSCLTFMVKEEVNNISGNLFYLPLTNKFFLATLFWKDGGWHH